MPDSVFSERYVLGYSVGWEFSVAPSGVDGFSELSRDFNEIHVSSASARERGFPDRVVHGVLLLAQVSRLIGEMLPDKDCVMSSLTVDFHKPAHPDEPLAFYAEIAEVHVSVRMVSLKYTVRRRDELLCRGRVQAVWRPVS